MLYSLVGKITIATSDILRMEYNKKFLTAQYLGFGVARVCFMLTLFMGKTNEKDESTVNEIEYPNRHEQNWSAVECGFKNLLEG